MKWVGLTAILMAALLSTACRGDSSDDVLYIGGIPDQKAAKLTRRFTEVANYLSGELGVKVKYVPSADYAAVVSGFKHGDIHLGWFGGLTGVQARAFAPGSLAIAQRPRDREFRSVFIVQKDLEADSLEDLEGITFTFGSESSTSGHLMPRYYLSQAGIDSGEDFQGPPSFSGSHDKTWKLVEGGSFDAGALNEAVWETAVDEGKVDLSRVRVLYTTPPYYDYNWSIRGDLHETFGQGFENRVRAALLGMGPEEREILDLFLTDSFIETDNAKYMAIEEVARRLDIIR